MGDIIRNISRVDQAVCWPDFTAPYSTKPSAELSSCFRLTLSCCSTTSTVDEVQRYARYARYIRVSARDVVVPPRSSASGLALYSPYCWPAGPPIKPRAAHNHCHDNSWSSTSSLGSHAMAAAGCFVLVEGSGEAPTFSSPSAHLQHQLNHVRGLGQACMAHSLQRRVRTPPGPPPPLPPSFRPPGGQCRPGRARSAVPGGEPSSSLSAGGPT